MIEYQLSNLRWKIKIIKGFYDGYNNLKRHMPH